MLEVWLLIGFLAFAFAMGDPKWNKINREIAKMKREAENAANSHHNRPLH